MSRAFSSTSAVLAFNSERFVPAGTIHALSHDEIWITDCSPRKDFVSLATVTCIYFHDGILLILFYETFIDTLSVQSVHHIEILFDSGLLGAREMSLAVMKSIDVVIDWFQRTIELTFLKEKYLQVV